MNDAYYTALVFQTFPVPSDALGYSRAPKQLIHPDHDGVKRGKGELYGSMKEAMASEQALQPKCPVCGKPLALEEAGYIPQAADKYIGIGKCGRHGQALVRLRFRASQSGRVALFVDTVKATASNLAYVHTKQFQMAQRKKAGIRINPELALRNAERSSVPFDE